jgi:preprotein translocase SecE subunit
MAYKPEQGRVARTAAYWSLALLLVYGCVSLNATLSQWFPGTLGKVFGQTPNASGQLVGGWRVPILSWKITPALGIAVVVCVAALWLLYRYLNKPKSAELLIETENELKKVTWPTMNEAFNSSVVVIVCVVFLMAFLAGADYVLGQGVTWILLGGG